MEISKLVVHLCAFTYTRQHVACNICGYFDLVSKMLKAVLFLATCCLQDQSNHKCCRQHVWGGALQVRSLLNGGTLNEASNLLKLCPSPNFSH